MGTAPGTEEIAAILHAMLCTLPDPRAGAARHMTVLIVDDHATFRASARLLLESEGFEVVGEADDGRSAIEQTEALSPDLILLDVQLPDIDGFEVANRVTSRDRGPAVILVSSHESGDFGSLVGACGARGFVAKADLSGARVRALLDR